MECLLLQTYTEAIILRSRSEFGKNLMVTCQKRLIVNLYSGKRWKLVNMSIKCKFAGIFSPELNLKCQDKVSIVPARICGIDYWLNLLPISFSLWKLSLEWSHSIAVAKIVPRRRWALNIRWLWLSLSNRTRNCKHSNERTLGQRWTLLGLLMITFNDFRALLRPFNMRIGGGIIHHIHHSKVDNNKVNVNTGNFGGE